jgi:hypothetical protein
VRSDAHYAGQRLPPYPQISAHHGCCADGTDGVASAAGNRRVTADSPARRGKYQRVIANGAAAIPFACVAPPARQVIRAGRRCMGSALTWRITLAEKGPGAAVNDASRNSGEEGWRRCTVTQPTMVTGAESQAQ